jgi:hypothetical protein
VRTALAAAPPPMIRIAISQEAFDAIAATLPVGSVGSLFNGPPVSSAATRMNACE